MEMPKQAIPESEKDEQWHKNNVDYFITQSIFGGTIPFDYKGNKIQIAYDAYNDRLQKE